MTPAYAFSFYTLFENNNQRASRLMAEKKYADAEKNFSRPDWQAVAAYRGNNYTQAAEQFKQLDGELGFYNQGNALAYLGKYQEAIAAYDKTLKINPNHQDAKYNRDLLKKLQEENKQDQDKNKQDQDQNQQDQDKNKQDQDQNQQDQDKNKQDQDQKQQDQDQKQQDQDKNKQDQDQKQQDQDKNKQDQDQKQQAQEQALRLIPDDPGGLLREKFSRDHWRRLKAARS
jgi:Ca-activated chloride channel family protein